MEGISNDRRDLVKAIYEQHWLHARHVENQRLWFTNVFALLCVGSLAMMDSGLFNEANWSIVGFLMVLSLFGFVFCLRIQGVFEAHKSVAGLILERYGLEHYLTKYPETVARKFFRLSLLFPAFFLFCFNFFLFVLLQIVFYDYWISALIPVLIFVVSTVVLYLSKYDEPVQREED